MTGEAEGAPGGKAIAGRWQVLLVAVFLAAAVAAVYWVPREAAPPATVLSAAELLGFGILVGAYGTMVGAGGGFLVVPAMLLIYHVRPEQAAGTGLAVVFLNASSGTISYARQGRVDYKAGLLFALATLPGAVSGAYVSRLLTGRVFDLIFGFLLLAIAVFLIIRPTAQEEYAEALLEEAEQLPWWRVRRRLTDAGGESFHYRYNVLAGMAISFAVGLLSSVLGIGGGIIHVPVLIHVLGFPAHIATATSHFILAISALVAGSTHAALGHVLVGPALLMGIGVAGGAQLGAPLARRLRGSLVIRLLSLALILVALRLLLR